MTLRLRLKFQRGILRKSQRSEGLKRSWILVHPQHETISEVVSHLLHAFNLYNTCPNGVLLYIDDFVLPPFASINILKDKDLICVKRKEAKLECRKETAYLEYNVLGKQTLKECLQLLPNEVLGKEIGFRDCENGENVEKETDVLHDKNVPNEDVPVKKRKSSREHKNPKRKRLRQVLHNNDDQEDQKEHHGACLQNGDSSNKLSKSKQDRITEADGRKRQHQVLQDNDVQEKLEVNHGACFQNGGPSKKLSRTKQDHTPEADGYTFVFRRKRQHQVLHDNDEQDNQKEHHGTCLQNDVSSKKLSNTKRDHTPEAAMNHKANAVCSTLDASGDGTAIPSGVLSRTRQSRSSKRKKAKRKWRTAEKEQLLKKQSLEEDSNADLGTKKDKNLDDDSHQQPEELKDRNLDTGNNDLQPDEDSDTENETVPVVVRPGHIRFAARGKEEDTEQDIEEKEPFSWSGTIIKKKGQKWGRENQPASKWNGNRAPCGNQSSYTRDECGSPKEQQSHSTQHDSVTPCTTFTTEELSPENALSVDYEKLVPMTDTPVEGDIVAYRLLELSSSFCPELTAYRVGKVSWFDPESQTVILVPVPQYPLELTKSPDDDTSEELPDTSCYNEDGSLEIDFQSLVDVRIVKHSEVSPTASLTKNNGLPASILEHPSKSGKQTEAPQSKDSSIQAQYIRINENGVKNNPGSENGAKDAWEDIGAALIAKKAELLKEDKCNNKRPFWPYRAMRRSAMGPTLALLRAQNNCQTE
ncbi:hypothetical protein V2J09_013148 [Rumex salicifolius]